MRKYITLIIISLIHSHSVVAQATKDSLVVSDTIIAEFTDTQRNLINKSLSVTEESVFILHFDEDGYEVDVMFLGEETKVLMTIDDMNKINNNYLLVDILEELVSRYNIEGDLSLSVVDALTGEILLLNDRIAILKGDLDNKDVIIETLTNVVSELRKSNIILEEVHSEQSDIIDIQSNQIKKHKKDKLLIAGGSGILIILFIIFGS